MVRLASNYDHLAGELGVLAFEYLLRDKLLEMSAQGLRPSAAGIKWFGGLGIDTTAAADQRRTYCRACMDWSERRHHLAGALGAALLTTIFELGWARRAQASRVIQFTPRGEGELRKLVVPVGAA